MFLLLIGSLWFWLSFVGVLALFVCTAKESFISGIIVILVTAVSLQLLGSVDILGWLKENLATIAICAVVYLPIGTAWAFFKWYMKLIDKRQELSEKKDAYMSRYKNSPDKEWNDIWTSHVKSHMPKSEYHKSSITTWIGYWPISMIWTLLDDFVTKLIKTIYNSISGIFNRMSENMFKNV